MHALTLTVLLVCMVALPMVAPNVIQMMPQQLQDKLEDQMMRQKLMQALRNMPNTVDSLQMKSRREQFPGIEFLPEELLNMTEIVRYYGYPVEEHQVQTDDGYINTMLRIPHGIKSNPSGPREVVILQHGLVDSGCTWLMNPPHQSLGYILADAGFDVWIGNARGNTYSRKHIKWTTKDDEFWNFSFDEMAKYDLPAMINYVLNVTKQPDLFYVGHSQGTMMGFAGFGENQEIAKKVKLFVALAPVATVSHIKGMMKVLSYFTPEMETLFTILGVQQFAPNNWLVDFFADVVCAADVTEEACSQLMFLICGYDVSNLNATRMPVYVSHTPAGTSVKDVIHFAQLIKSNKFGMYDYGPHGNMDHYGQSSPPEYDLTKVKVPIAFITGANDWLADPYDAYVNLYPLLSNVVFRKDIKAWNHMDFVWGVNAKDLIYDDIIRLFKGHQ